VFRHKNSNAKTFSSQLQQKTDAVSFDIVEPKIGAAEKQMAKLTTDYVLH